MMRIGAADLVTLANGFLGTLAITYILDGEHVIASLLIMLAVVMDGLDGIIARKFKSPHEFGRFLDSISDAVSFCLAPGLILYSNFYDKELGTAWVSFPNALATAGVMFYVVFGLLRLARFAGKEYKRLGFLGLPTPAAAMVLVTICLLWGNGELNPFAIGYELEWIIGAVVLLSFLMVSDVPYPMIRGKLALVVGVCLVPGIIPIFTYLATPSSNLPYAEFLLLFLGLLIIYALWGPVYETNRLNKKKKSKDRPKA